MNKILFSCVATVFLCCIALPNIAQNKQNSIRLIDSMIGLLPHLKDDSNKVILLSEIGYQYNTISPYDGIKYATHALMMAEDLNWQRGIARSNSCLGANYYSLSFYKNAYEYWLNALRINEKLNYTGGIANQLHNIGDIFFSEGDDVKALDYYNRALTVSQTNGNKSFATNSYTAIGNVYERQHKFDEALEYHFKALAMDEDDNNLNNIASDKVNIALIYSSQGNFVKSLEMLFSAISIKNAIGEKSGIAKTYCAIANVYLNIANNEIEQNSGKSNEETKQVLIKTVDYADSAIVIDKETGNLENLQKCYACLAEAYEKLDKIPLALENYKKKYAIKDSMFSLNKQMEIYNMERREELYKQTLAAEQQELSLKRREYIEIAGIVLSIFMMISVILVLRKKHIKLIYIELLGTSSIVVFFEFMQLLIHYQIKKVAHNDTALTLLLLIPVAAIFVPTHNKIERWMKARIGSKQ